MMKTNIRKLVAGMFAAASVASLAIALPGGAAPAAPKDTARPPAKPKVHHCCGVTCKDTDCCTKKVVSLGRIGGTGSNASDFRQIRICKPNCPVPDHAKPQNCNVPHR